MEIAKLVLSYIQAVLSWPVAVMVLVLYFLIKFKKPIKTFLNRVQKGEVFGVKLELGQMDQQKAVEAVASVVPILDGIQAPSTDKSLQDSASDNAKIVIDSFLANPTQTAEGVVIMAKNYMFERVYNSIFGTQIELLEHLAGKGDKGDSYKNLFSFYQTFTKQLDPTPPTITYDAYLDFLKNMILIEKSSQTDGHIFQITELGVEFLSYLKTQYGLTYKHKTL